MKTKFMTRAACLIVIAFIVAILVMPAITISAEEPPWPSGLPWLTTTPWPTAHPLAVGVPFSSGALPAQTPAPVNAPPPPVVLSSPVIVPPSPASVNVSPSPVVLPATNVAPVPVTRGGTSRQDALTPTDTWQTLGAGSSAWYLIGSDGAHMQVFLDAELHLGVSLDIFAPNQSDVPIGRGTPLKAEPTRLFWEGGSWRTNGEWYAAVRNNNPVPVRYKIASTAKPIGAKSCYSYWEYIGTNLVYWTECR